MRLPKPGTKSVDLKCKVCQKGPKEQPDDMNECANKLCPYDKEKPKDEETV